ncbi:ThiF family adenylyltransferase [Desulfovibrio litoralis]|uniref:Molybdopterin or thiamine biosynthesis adenylyltransferase n=1 Tax=Desulfovibrio litoralis DSM 11393 TaxID=1121455 RepID=A0A1M7THD9_9BACT|nr:ThiF family adenylyltransferase [Desulfovibrio litoralis]SHN70147.1 Molybdopterin or thiamine biosynthesis adenylyltransferase [Desulfovibrio litoralis DSM 11393]
MNSSNLLTERYLRNQTTLSLIDQEKLFNSKVLIVGLGGLGGYVLEHLARVGVGGIRACDPDVFEASNLNRQLLSTEDGAIKHFNKTQLAKERAQAVNSSIKTEFFSCEFSPEMLSGVDLVLDCLGGAKDRAFLHNSAYECGVPLISAAVAGWSFLVSTILSVKNETGEKIEKQTKLGELMTRIYINNEQSLEESIGTIVSSVNLAACIQSSEAIRFLTGDEPCLANKILLGDLSVMSFKTFNL